MSTKVLLHVGTPKTGTSHLQDVLFRNRETLLEHGISYPADRFDGHFLAALDLMQLPWGGLEREAVGAWDDLAARVRAHSGTSVVSHEILATASRPQIARALRDLGADDGVEVHLVISTRDLVRQIPAEWQENVKHRATLTYADFLATITDPDRPGRIGNWFWGVQEIPDILDRWGGTLPPERVHVVTVPAPGAPPEELWRRFSRVFGLDGLPLDLTPEKANPSMGVPETALLRRVNTRVVDDVAPADYRPLVREVLAHQTLSRRRGSARLALPPQVHAWAQDLSRSWIAEVERRGYRVEGDLADLVGRPAGDWADPDNPDPEETADAALDAVAALVHECVRIRREEERLHAEVRDLHVQLASARMRPGYRVRERIVGRLNRSRLGRGALQVYRRVRGRSSRAA